MFRLLHSEAAAFCLLQQRLALAERLSPFAHLDDSEPRLAAVARSALTLAVREIFDVAGESASHTVRALLPRLREVLRRLSHAASPGNSKGGAGTRGAAGAAAPFGRQTRGLGGSDGADVTTSVRVGRRSFNQGGGYMLDAGEGLVAHTDQRFLEEAARIVGLVIARLLDGMSSSLAVLEEFHAARVQNR